MEKLNVFIDARTANPHFPGIGRYVSNLVKAMTAFQDQISIHILRASHPIGFPSSSGLKETSTCASVFSLRQQWVVPRLIDRYQASLYHGTYYLMPYCVNVPVVFTCYDLIPIVYPQYFSYFQRVVYRIAHLIAARVSSQIIAISDSTKSDLTRYFSLDKQKVTAIPLAAGEAFRPQSTSVIHSIRDKYDLPSLYCLYVGTNKPHKNLTGLLKAWQIVQRDGASEGHALVIAGQWDKRYPEAREFALKNGLDETTRFIGKVDEEDLPALYSGATVFIQPSLYEGFGLPIIEAMACGTAVACSNSSSLPEVAGDAAHLFNPKDHTDIAGSLGNLLTDCNKRTILREKSLFQASMFSWERTARNTLGVYWRAYDSRKS
jgi:alpha-1,3-rhamnosyl/mannosyltransferase